jgi:hypothetical protein
MFNLPELASRAVSFAPANPAAITSVTPVMLGLGTTCLFTPISSGKTMVAVSGFASTATAAVAVTLNGRFGTGSAPANAAAASGTVFGPVGNIALTGSAVNLPLAFSFNAVVTLTAASTYWFDLTCGTANGSDAASVVNVTMSFYEIA